MAVTRHVTKRLKRCEPLWPERNVTPFEEVAISTVYFVEGVGVDRIKIGFTTNLKERMEGLQAGSPVLLKVVRAMAGTVDKEIELHHQFLEGTGSGVSGFRSFPVLEWLHKQPADMFMVPPGSPKKTAKKKRSDSFRRRLETVKRKNQDFQSWMDAIDRLEETKLDLG